MKTFYRFTAVLLIFLLCSSFLGGCGGGDEPETTVQPTTITVPEQARELKLPYAKADPLNPYKAQSMVNLQLSALLYDCLFRPGANYNAQPVIATDYTLEGLSLTVRLKAGIVFSDTSALTADDVVYSFKNAQTAPTYSASLSNFSAIKKADATSVVFTLKSPEPYAVNCLDFPIVKNEDKAEPPTGSGRYTLAEKDGKVLLESNATRLGGFSPQIKTIRLVAVSDSDSLNYALQIGNIDFFFTDLSNGSYRRINASSVEVGLNNLVFLGLNNASVKLQNADVRQAIALLIDKNTLAATAFQGHARAALTPFNPDFAGIAGYDFMPDTNNPVQLLEQAGYTKLKDNGVRYSGYNTTLEFNLLVNADNPFKVETAKQIAQELMAAGIKVNVTALDFNAYSAAVQSWKFDMYLGEVLLSSDMSLTPLLAPSGSVSYGINTTGFASAAYSLYKSGTSDLKSFIDAFSTDMPFVPLCYRNGIAAYSRELKVPQECHASDVYSDIEAWTF